MEELGSTASGNFSKFIIKEIPKTLESFYYIAEYDGLESIAYHIPSKWLRNKINEVDPDNLEEWKQKIFDILNVYDKHQYEHEFTRSC